MAGVGPAVAAGEEEARRRGLGLGRASGTAGTPQRLLSAPSPLGDAPPRGAEGGGRGAAMAEEPSALPWSINKDDYELQEVIGERSLGCGGVQGAPRMWECESAEGRGLRSPSAEGDPVTHRAKEWDCVASPSLSHVRL